MPGFHLAQINVARLKAPLDDPLIADFVAMLDPINALAEQSPGFVWRLRDDNGNATEIAFNDDPLLIVNMSVWESVERLRDFTYRSNHMEAFRKRSKWFDVLEEHHYCLWWVPAGHIPTVAAARERLEAYRANGSTPFSFWFSKIYPEPAAELISA